MDPHLARWLLLGGYACAIVLLLGCGVLTAAERRRPGSSALNTATRHLGDLAGLALAAAFIGALGVVTDKSSSPVPSAESYLLVLAVAVGLAIGLALLAIFALAVSEVDYHQTGQPLPPL